MLLTSKLGVEPGPLDTKKPNSKGVKKANLRLMIAALRMYYRAVFFNSIKVYLDLPLLSGIPAPVSSCSPSSKLIRNEWLQICTTAETSMSFRLL